MAGYESLLKMRRIEDRCKVLGFRLGNPRHGGWSGLGNDDLVALFPAEDALPIYTRDAELFIGSFADLERWLQGVDWARDYYKMLNVVDDKKVARKEQDERNRQLAQLIKTSATKVNEMESA